MVACPLHLARSSCWQEHMRELAFVSCVEGYRECSEKKSLLYAQRDVCSPLHGSRSITGEGWKDCKRGRLGQCCGMAVSWTALAHHTQDLTEAMIT